MTLTTPINDLVEFAKDSAVLALERCRSRDDPAPLLFLRNRRGQVSAVAAYALAGPEQLREAAAASLLRIIPEEGFAEVIFSAAAWHAPLSAKQAASSVPLAPAPSAHPARAEVLTVAHWTPAFHDVYYARIYRRGGKAPQPGEWQFVSRQTEAQPGLQPLLGWNVVEALRVSATAQERHGSGRRTA